MEVKKTRRIVLLGKTGAGKSSLANTIFGEKVFTVNHSLSSETKQCQAKTRSVNGRSVTLIDTPGFFDTDMSKEEVSTEITTFITECAPGLHAFLIVLKFEKYTEQEKDVIRKMSDCLSEGAFKYAAVVFTRGDQVPEGQKIEDIISDNKGMRDLVKRCGDRCHIFDNKYWENKQQDEYRSNKFQVAKLLDTIDNIVLENNGCYTNKMLQRVEEDIQQKKKEIRQLSENMPDQEIREKARVNVSERLLIRLASTATGTVLGAFLGVPRMIKKVIKVMSTVPQAESGGATGLGKAAGVVMAARRATEGTVGAAGLSVVVGAVAAAAVGGHIGYCAGEQAESVGEGVKYAAKAVRELYEDSNEDETSE